MHRGAILFTTAAALACSACLADQGKLEIRSVKTGLKAGSEPVPYRIAEAYGQLALGNVALALEGFRKASREDPASVDALAGIAQCYDKMHRFDLSRRYYEQALAMAPRDGALLGLLASSLDQQGLAKQAASVRREMAAASAATPASAMEEPSELVEAAEARELEQAVAAAVPGESPPVKVAAPVQAAPVKVAAPVQPPQVAAPVGKSVTIALAPPRPVEAARNVAPKPDAMPVAPVGKSVTIALASLPPAPAAKPVTRTPPAPIARNPRVERISLTEVALITGNGPRWSRLTSPAVMNRMVATKPTGLRLLNAARVDKLAARTRNYLGQFGWRQVMVGDAPATRSKSLILYPQAARAEAARLASRFGFAMAPRSDVRQLTILLGCDAAQIPALQPKA